MSSKSSSSTSSVKRSVQHVQQTSSSSSAQPTPAKQIKKEPTEEKLKSKRQHDRSEEDIIRSRLLYEGDQGIDDRRILILMKTFQKYIFEQTPNSDENHSSIEKLLSLLYSIEHSHRLFKSTYEMDECEQLCYAVKNKRLNEQLVQLRQELERSESRLIEAKQKRLNLLEYDARTDTINKLGTRRELRAQQAATLERKHYFEHLQQTFEATYQQRLKQIAVYMRPIFEMEEILRQDADEDVTTDGPNESPAEQQAPSVTSSTLPLVRIERQRANSDSSTASMDADDGNSTSRSKKSHRNDLGLNSLSNSLTNNQPQALFSTETELFGTQLVNPLLLLSSTNIS